MYTGNMQHDAHELFQCLLSNVDDASTQLVQYWSRVSTRLKQRSKRGRTADYVAMLHSVTDCMYSKHESEEDHYVSDPMLTDQAVTNKKQSVTDVVKPTDCTIHSVMPRVEQEGNISLININSKISMRKLEAVERGRTCKVEIEDISRYLMPQRDAVSNIVKDVFEGVMLLKTKCLRCQNTAECRQKYLDISLATQQSDAGRYYHLLILTL